MFSHLCMCTIAQHCDAMKSRQDCKSHLVHPKFIAKPCSSQIGWLLLMVLLHDDPIEPSDRKISMRICA
uniref:Ovule protein n=1 Tax=Steinernema glaseri TaxID=37863 RepID=A0A1I7XZQ1_9BILA